MAEPFANERKNIRFKSGRIQSLGVLFLLFMGVRPFSVKIALRAENHSKIDPLNTTVGNIQTNNIPLYKPMHFKKQNKSDKAKSRFWLQFPKLQRLRKRVRPVKHHAPISSPQSLTKQTKKLKQLNTVGHSTL